MKTKLIIKDRIRKGDALIERIIRVVPTPVNGCSHHFKYRLYCRQDGTTVVRYDNESGKGDHRYPGRGERQQPYLFITLEQLIIDFEADVIRLLEGAKMKAIIELANWKTSQVRALRAAKKADAGKPAPADYHLDFDSMASLFSDITQAQMQVIETSKQLGALSVYALAKATGQNYSNVYRDVRKLLGLELLARDEDGKIYVPWKDVVRKVSPDW